jgi:hypothetical protein
MQVIQGLKVFQDRWERLVLKAKQVFKDRWAQLAPKDPRVILARRVYLG